MDKVPAFEVFTPTSPATHTFIDRNSINEKLVDALETTGKQLIIYGHSGSGKTTLIFNKLHQIYEHHVTTRCTTGLKFDQIVLNAFDDLNPFFEQKRIHNKRKDFSASIGSEYFFIKGSLEAKASHGIQTQESRILPPQLTIQRLAKFMGEANCCWVIEDIHRIAEEERKKIAEAMKIFMDMSVEYKCIKLIVIGIFKTAREVIMYEPEMQKRISEIYVPLMTYHEITQIINKGEEKLNLTIPSKVKSEIVKYSNGLASVCHQLCLNACIASGIRFTTELGQLINTESFEKALIRYTEEESETTKAAFEMALRKKRQQKYDYCHLILKTLSEYDEDDKGMTSLEILTKIRNEITSFPASNSTKYLKQLCTEERGTIINFDETSGKFSFSNPFYKVFAKVYFAKHEEIFETGSLYSHFSFIKIDAAKKITEAMNEMKKGLSITFGRSLAEIIQTMREAEEKE